MDTSQGHILSFLGLPLFIPLSYVLVYEIISPLPFMMLFIVESTYFSSLRQHMPVVIIA